MLPSIPVLGSARAGTLGRLAVAASTTVFLAACASSGGGGSENRGLTTVASEQSTTIETYLSQGYCPPVEVRPGTEKVIVYDRGHDGDPAYVRYQGSISQTARECHGAGQSLSIKLGIAGRVTAGPKGGEGTATMPVRVAVVKQTTNTVLYSEVFRITGTVTAPNYSGDFQQIVEGITLQLGPSDRDLIIYVGYDLGPPKPTPTG